MPQPWSLHPQLASDTIHVGDLPLSQLRLMNDANYPWLLLVPRRSGISEIIDLDSADRVQLTTEIVNAGHVLKKVTTCDKLNVAAIGNVVPQLHVHVVARHRGDAVWPRPVWGAAPPRAYEPAALKLLIGAIQRRLQIA